MGSGNSAPAFNFNVPGQRKPTDTSNGDRIEHAYNTMLNSQQGKWQNIPNISDAWKPGMFSKSPAGYDATKANPYQYLANGTQPQGSRTLSSASSRALLG